VREITFFIFYLMEEDLPVRTGIRALRSDISNCDSDVIEEVPCDLDFYKSFALLSNTAASRRLFEFDTCVTSLC
jgi:hypothetical protein